MKMHINNETKNPCDIDSSIPVGYGCVISKMMAKKAHDRYSSPNKLLLDLEALKAGQPAEALDFRGNSSCAMPATLAQKGLQERKPVLHGTAGTSGVFRQSGRSLFRRSSKLAASLAALIVCGGGMWYLSNEFYRPAEEPVLVKVTAPAVPQPPTQPAAPKPKETTPPPKMVAEIVPVPDDSDPQKTKDQPPTLQSKIVPPPLLPSAPAPVPASQKPAAPFPPAVEIPAPKLVLTADVLYARFLRELKSRAARLDLHVLQSEMAELARKPEYQVARDDLKAELADLATAQKFEGLALKSLAAQGGEIELKNETAKKFGKSRAAIKSLDPGRGLILSVDGAEFPISANDLPMNEVLQNASAASPLEKACYLSSRAELELLPASLAALPEKEKPRWDRKLRLLEADEAELMAQLVFDNLDKVAAAQSWRTLAGMIKEFESLYGGTKLARSKTVQLEEWKANETDNVSSWRRIFHPASLKELPDGYLELVYDFNTPEQALDFVCPHGRLTIADHRLLVPPGGGELGQACFIAPVDNLRSFSATGKSLQEKMRRMRVIFFKSKDDNPLQDPALVLRPATSSTPNHPCLDNMGDEPPNALEINWLQDVKLAAESRGHGQYEWFVNGQPLGKGKIEDMRGRYLALAAKDGNNSWAEFKIVLRVDQNGEFLKNPEPVKKTEP
jgi:hypothetical protein